MPDPHDPRGFVVEWQLADDAAIGMTHSFIDLSADGPDHEVVLTDDVLISTSSGG
jgi:hypothetical protein